MKKAIILAVSLVFGTAHAQTYPTPTFAGATFKGSVTIPSGTVSANISASTSTPTGATIATSNADREARRYYIDDFGCVGDGVTDDSLCLARAFAHMTSGGTLYLNRTKYYYFANPPQIPTGVVIDGGNGQVGPVQAGWAYLPNNPASGNISFTDNPVNGDSINIGGTNITFTTSAPIGNQILIGDSLSATISNALAFLNASADSNIDRSTYYGGYFPAIDTDSNAPIGTIELVYKSGGPSGNSFQISVISSVGKVSASTLQFGGAPSQGGTIVLDSVNGLIPGNRSSIQNTFIIHKGLIIPPGPSYALQQINGFLGNAVDNTAGAGDWSITNDMIIGFNTAVNSCCAAHNGSRIHIDGLLFDATNGVNLAGVYDMSSVSNSMANSYYVGSNQSSVYNHVYLNFRSGIAFQIHDGSSGSSFSNDFSYGHAIKFSFGNEFGIICTNCSYDGPSGGSKDPKVAVVPEMSSVGSNYSSSPTITASCGGSFVATVSSGRIIGITNTSPTNNCNGIAPTVNINDATGTGASASAQLVASVGVQTYGRLSKTSVTSGFDSIQGIGVLANSLGSLSFYNVQAASNYLADFEINGGADIIGGVLVSKPSSSHIIFGPGSSGGIVALNLFGSTSGGPPIRNDGTGTVSCIGNVVKSTTNPDTCYPSAPFNNGSSLYMKNSAQCNSGLHTQAGGVIVLSTTDASCATSDNTNALLISSPSANPTVTVQNQLILHGNITTNSGAATVSACGTGASVSGNVIKGTVTPGSGSPTTCTINFPSDSFDAYTKPPVCITSPYGTSPASAPYEISSTTSGFVVGAASMGQFSFICIQ